MNAGGRQLLFKTSSFSVQPPYSSGWVIAEGTSSRAIIHTFGYKLTGEQTERADLRFSAERSGFSSHERCWGPSDSERPALGRDSSSPRWRDAPARLDARSGTSGPRPGRRRGREKRLGRRRRRDLPPASGFLIFCGSLACATREPRLLFDATKALLRMTATVGVKQMSTREILTRVLRSNKRLSRRSSRANRKLFKQLLSLNHVIRIIFLTKQLNKQKTA